MKAQFLQVVTVLDDSKFKDLRILKPKRNIQAKKQALYDNIWSMFTIPSDAKAREVSVSDFAWTSQVSKQFYDHPFHKEFMADKNIWPGASRGFFSLQAEPADIQEGQEYEISQLSRHERAVIEKNKKECRTH